MRAELWPGLGLAAIVRSVMGGCHPKMTGHDGIIFPDAVDGMEVGDVIAVFSRLEGSVRSVDHALRQMGRRFWCEKTSDWVDDPGFEPVTVWHVTPRENVESILQEGLYPGLGDDGLGVYVFTSLASAEAYAAKGGWNGAGDPEEMVILEIEAQAHELAGIVPNPEWPNPDAYHAIMVWRADEDDPEAEHRAWRPKRLRMETEVPPGFTP